MLELPSSSSPDNAAKRGRSASVTWLNFLTITHEVQTEREDGRRPSIPVYDKYEKLQSQCQENILKSEAILTKNLCIKNMYSDTGIKNHNTRLMKRFSTCLKKNLATFLREK